MKHTSIHYSGYDFLLVICNNFIIAILHSLAVVVSADRSIL